MIQVIKRAFDIIELLSKEEKLNLKDIANKVDIKKTTTCNILKTLVDLGYIEKKVNTYTFGSKLISITSNEIKKSSILHIAEDNVKQLTNQTKEAVVVAILYKGERYTIVQSSFNQSIIVNTNIFQKGSIYDTATGRVLLAYLEEKELREIVNKKGIPKDEWPEVKSYKDLKNALLEIKKKKICFKITNDNQVQALAVPVFGPDGKVWASIGIYLPLSRFKGEHKKEIIKNLIFTGERMSYILSLANKKFIEGGKNR